MKKLIAVVLSVLLIQTAFAQSKSKQKDKAPTQKEMEEMMKEAQQMMNEMDPEDKRMMDSMGISMPSFKNIPKVSDRQLAEAYENENRLVPKRHAVRIASIAAIPQGNAAVSSFITSVQNKTMPLLKPDSKIMGEKLYVYLDSSGSTPSAMGNASVGLWMIGKIEIGFYLLGKACKGEPSNTDNISNYAAMLSMLGAEHMAIPLLNNLNAKFPQNSTILNNLGQAWFGLGEITKAEKYLDSAIRLYAYHPQANFTRCFIEESKGKKQEAVSFLKKSIKHAYTKAKEEKLNKLGQKLKVNDAPLPPMTKSDPFNLGGFKHPGFPKSVDESIAMEPVWQSFVAKIKSEETGLKKKAEEQLKIVTEAQQSRLQHDMNVIKKSISSGMPQGNLITVPLYNAAASLKQQVVMEEFEKRLMENTRKTVAFMNGRGLELTEEYDAEMEKLREEDGEQTGEGRPNKDFCPKYKATSDKFLSAYNPEREELFNEALDIYKKYYNEMTYWQMYSQWPEEYEYLKLSAKANWLGNLISCRREYCFKSITQFKCTNPLPGKEGQLSNFDDVACQYHSELNLGALTMKSDCSRMTTELDAGVIKLGLKQDMDKETFSDQFMTCNVEVGPRIGKEVHVGPLTVGAEAGVTVGAEFDRNGLSGVTVGAGASAGVGPVNAGLEGRINLISGASGVTGTGVFSGVK